MSEKTYIGDSVYVEVNDEGVVLTTNNGYTDDPRNRIVLSSTVWLALMGYLMNRQPDRDAEAS